MAIEGSRSSAMTGADLVSGSWLIIWLSMAWIGYAYAGYPLMLFALRRFSPLPAPSSAGPEAPLPRVSVIIAVHNGAREIAEKLENTLGLAYPSPLEILVSSDGSTDGTVEIGERYAGRGVVVVTAEERRGKEAAQARAIARARGDVLVFTDVGALLEPEALRNLVRPLLDPGIGSVSSEDVVEAHDGEGVYVRFEMALRRLESEATTLIGLSGSLFAVRRELCTPWPTDLASDFRVALETARRGYRAVSEPTARASFRVATDPAAEWRRKVRTVRRGIAVLSAHRGLLHPRHGRAAFSIWGHKVARFTVPFALLALLVGSAVAARTSSLALALLGLQLIGYAIGSFALLGGSIANILPARIASFFLLVNASILVAWAYHLSGQRSVVWNPTQRA
jgi:cellulose synthase/poly-beta-1,6-N-acetylglucosamine synthase-like glycosyltransferase